ncbi:hypothetical protein Poly51_32280 [Rubripirellula tenax]|uniref:Uncharacterized protein n=1 Tax=Rubripirellula tenax TaxID=2528015 RepID=A0A5C6F3Y6_9BACT|nr:hypothetical protein [Rubripirellula tenax]TWU54509.1 hypothetical protein Poly51_32280 [Rubripirellula tenax]
MNRYRISLCAAGLAFFASSAIVVSHRWANAQDATEIQGGSTAAITDKIRYGDVPPAALLTERGRQLAEELGHLERSKASMGARHPSRAAIDAQMESIRRELKAWASAPEMTAETDENPFAERDAAPQMNGVDLRQLVLILTERVERLERKVTALERRQ